MKEKEKLSQVWQWSGAQRRSDRWMNKAYINACGRLVGVAKQSKSKFGDVLDVGSGSGLVLRHLVGNGGEFKTYLGTLSLIHI